ncbi:MAG: SixA phosphatase family protein, partial [Bacteroidota bacterium]
MVIILLRHAKAVQSTGDIPDFERPLRPKGIKQCSALAEAVPDVLELTEGIRPRIWCSPAYRTRQTLAYGLPWAQRKPNLATEDLPRYPDWLYLAESPRYQLELLADGNGRPLLIIGHNNGI